MKLYHYLTPPTEEEIITEIIAFNEAILQYHQALQMKKEKQKGLCPCISPQAIDWAVDRYYQKAYEKIPTLWLIELQEMLNQNKIQWT